MIAIIIMRFVSYIKNENDILMPPDVVSSMRIDQEQYLTIVENRNKIEDKEEFAELLIQMYKENAFDTIKISTDQGCVDSVYMNIYLWEEDIEEDEPVMIVEYQLVGCRKRCDIVYVSEQLLCY